MSIRIANGIRGVFQRLYRYHRNVEATNEETGFNCQGDFDLYSWTFLSVFYLGWLAAPLTHLLLGFVVFLLFEGRQSWPGGLVSLVRWLGLLLGVGSVCEQL